MSKIEGGRTPHGDPRLALAWKTVEGYLREKTSTSLDISVYGYRGGEHSPKNRLRRAVYKAGGILVAEEFDAAAGSEGEGDYTPPISIVSSAKERIDSLMVGLKVACIVNSRIRDSDRATRETTRGMTERIPDERKRADAYVGAFAFHLTDGLIRAAIEGDLASVANLRGEVLPAVIERFAPAIADSRREFDEIDKLPKPEKVTSTQNDHKRGRVSYPREEVFDQFPSTILDGIDAVMERNGFILDETSGQYVNMLSQNPRS